MPGAEPADGLVPLGALIEGYNEAKDQARAEALERERKRVREPPHVSVVERAVVAAIMEHGRDALAACEEESLAPGDFYDERYGWIYEAARAVSERGAAVSPTSIVDRMGRVGTLGDAGGVLAVQAALERAAEWRARDAEELLENLVMAHGSSAPLSEVRTHARLVVDHARRRRVIDCCRGAVVKAQMGGQDGAAVLDETMRALAAIEVGAAGGVVDNRATAHGLMRSLPALGGTREAVPTGFHDLDRLLQGGLVPGDLVLIAGRPSMGKALADGELVMLPSGLGIPISQLHVGDQVMGSDGRPTKVTGVFPQGEVPLFRVILSDGCSIVTSADHLWTVATRHGQHEVTTAQLSSSPGKYRLPLFGGLAATTDFDRCWIDPVVDPYAVGIWLGDGSMNGSNAEVSKPEPDVLARFRAALPAGDVLVIEDGGRARVKKAKAGRGVSRFTVALRREGLAGTESHERFVPLHMLHGSDSVRRSVLAGLFDTDGHVTSSGRSVEFSTTSPRLADDVAFLVRSLGGICTVAPWRQTTFKHHGERRVGRPSVRMVCTFPDGYIPTRSRKHARRWKVAQRTQHRTVVKVEPVEPGRATCISVAAGDGLFVAHDFIVTHNSQIVLDVCEGRCVDHGRPVLFFSLEMAAEQLHTRIAGARSRVNPMRADADRQMQARLTRALGEVAEAPLRIDETPGLNVAQLRARARAQRRREPIELIVVDYLQLLDAERQVDNRAAEVGGISRALKGLARELRVPVVALSQLSRGVESRADKRPLLSDLRESGALEQDADVICFLYREEYYLRDATPGNKQGVAEVIVAKHRNGPTGAVSLHFGRRSDDPSDAPPRFGSLARGDSSNSGRNGDDDDE